MKKIKETAVIIMGLLTMGLAAAENLLPATGDWQSSGSGQLTSGVDGNTATLVLKRIGTDGRNFAVTAFSKAREEKFYLMTGKVRALSENAFARASVLGRTGKNQWLFQWVAPGIDKLKKDRWTSFSIRLFLPQTGGSLETAVEVISGTVEFTDLKLCEVSWKEGRAADAPPLEYWVNMDYNDEVVYSGGKEYGEAEIMAFFEKCRKAGVTGVQWRVSIMGQMSYRSKGAATTFPGHMPIGDMEPGAQLVARILQKIDPLKIAVREAKKQGIQLYIWMTLSDEGYTNDKIDHYNFPEFLIKNPQCMLMDRKGNVLKGTICYNEPAALKYRLDIVRELLAYGADGLYLCTRSHSSVFGNDRGDDYGFNPAIVKEYKKRYGIDVLKENFDIAKWRAIKSEGYDRLFHEISKLAKASGQKVRLGVSSIALCNNNFGGNWGNTPVDWQKYLKLEWVDSILSGQNKVEPFFASREINRFQEVARPGQKLYFWGQMVDYQGDAVFSPGYLLNQAEFFAFLGANGGVYHEAINLEYDMDKYMLPLGEFYRKPR